MVIEAFTTTYPIYISVKAAINAAILILIVHFSLSELVLYRRLMKRLFTTIDLSPNIFSPKIRLSRQIRRRIWMDTWSALLLRHENTAMDPRQKLRFIWGTDGPPTLESFEGLVAERHVENIKSMRSIGIKKYTEACHTLSAEEILLRQKIYNLFVGPGILCFRDKG